MVTNVGNCPAFNCQKPDDGNIACDAAETKPREPRTRLWSAYQPRARHFALGKFCCTRGEAAHFEVGIATVEKQRWNVPGMDTCCSSSVLKTPLRELSFRCASAPGKPIQFMSPWVRPKIVPAPGCCDVPNSPGVLDHLIVRFSLPVLTRATSKAAKVLPHRL